MVEKDNNSPLKGLNTLDEDSELDLSGFSQIIIRNKSFIAKITLISTFFSFLLAITTKRVWEGEFQIVVENNQKNNSRLFSSTELQIVRQLARRRGPDESLKTQIAILESPVVLMDIFDFVKKEKKIKGIKSFKNKTFNSWKKDSFDIKNEKRTKVLNIIYKDKNQDLIIPVLNKIAESYQDYSGKKRLREIELGVKFFENQINLFKKKSEESLKTAQKFVIDQDLAILNTDKVDEVTKGIPNFINIDALRSTSANEIRGIKFQLEKLENIKDAEALIFLSRTIEELVEQGLPAELDELDKNLMILKVERDKLNSKNDFFTINYFAKNNLEIKDSEFLIELESIEKELEFKKFIYTDNDKDIKKLKEKKAKLVSLIKEQTLEYINSEIEKLTSSRPVLIELLKAKSKSFLEAKKLAAEMKLKTSERPQDILIKYRELTDNAYRDKLTLDTLEKEYRVLLLEKAKNEDPWEIISLPTLNPFPVEPNRKLILLQGLLIGFVISTAIATLKEKRKKVFFTGSEISKYLNLPLITEFSIFGKNNQFSIEPLEILKKQIDSQKEYICFLSSEEIDNKALKKLNKILDSTFSENKYKFTTSLSEAIKYPKLFLISYLGYSKIDKINYLTNKIKILNRNLDGLIVISDYKAKIENKDQIENIINKSIPLILESKNSILNSLKKYNRKNFLKKLNHYISLVNNRTKE